MQVVEAVLLLLEFSREVPDWTGGLVGHQSRDDLERQGQVVTELRE